MEKKRTVPRWTEDFVSGALASLSTKLALQPFDTAKTILQSSRGSKYSNMGDCVVRMVRSEGACSLYRGLPAAVAASAPSSAVFFATYEHLKRKLRDRSKGSDLDVRSALLAACGANLVASLVRVPPEVIKQRVQMRLHADAWKAVLSIAKEDGVLGFYRGYVAQLLRDVPYAMAQFGTYEALRLRATRRRRNVENRTRKVLKDRDTKDALLRGALAGGVACVLTTPMDVIKTRTMTSSIGMKTRVGNGWWRTTRQVWSEGGANGLMRGVVPRLLYKVPSSAIFLFAYEIASLFMKRWNVIASSERRGACDNEGGHGQASRRLS